MSSVSLIVAQRSTLSRYSNVSSTYFTRTLNSFSMLVLAETTAQGCSHWGIRGHCLPNFLVPRNICLKHIMKTIILPP